MSALIDCLTDLFIEVLADAPFTYWGNCESTPPCLERQKSERSGHADKTNQ